MDKNYGFAEGAADLPEVGQTESAEVEVRGADEGLRADANIENITEIVGAADEVGGDKVGETKPAEGEESAAAEETNPAEDDGESCKVGGDGAEEAVAEKSAPTEGEAKAESAEGEENPPADEKKAVKSDRPSYIDGKIEDLDFGGRRALAREVINYLCGLSADADHVKSLKEIRTKFPVLAEVDTRAFDRICDTIKKMNVIQRNNLFAAYLLFYIFTSGRYPAQYWKEAETEYSETKLSRLRDGGRQFAGNMPEDGEYRGRFEELLKSCRRAYERQCVSAVLRKDDGFGMTKIYEMLWEVFFTKYCNYKAESWKNSLDEFASKDYVVREIDRNSVRVRCEYAEDAKNVQIYAVSYEGKLDKPMHTECEDCSFVEFYDDDTWLAVSCDGVGSCVGSAIGSYVATDAVSAAIGGYLSENCMLSAGRENARQRTFAKFLSGRDKKNADDGKWANMMGFFLDGFAAKVYDYWANAVTEICRERGLDAVDLGNYASTLQFAFGCRKFIACGRLGDGTYFVGKSNGAAEGRTRGGTMLDDAVSGVTQAEVLTVAHLKRNPLAIQVCFLRPEETDDIIISSDGCDSFLGRDVSALLKYAERLGAMPFGERCAALSLAARRCTEYNDTMYGSGDDSTIVHIHLKH